MMWCNFTGNVCSTLASLSYLLQSRRGREVSNVQVRLRLPRQLDVAGNDRCFGFSFHSTQSQLERCWTFMHRASLAHARVLGMLDHWNAERTGGLQSLTHDRVAQNGTAIVGYGNRACLD